MNIKLNLTKLKCHWCGSLVTFRCTCGYLTCIDCRSYPGKDGCIHRKTEPIESDKWIWTEKNDTIV